jgi:hypothetical protein
MQALRVVMSLNGIELAAAEAKEMDFPVTLTEAGRRSLAGGSRLLVPAAAENPLDFWR